MSKLIPTADFTGYEVNLRLKHGSYTPVTFTFTELNFTGYGAATFKWSATKTGTPITIPAAVTTAVDGLITVSFSSTEWAAIAGTTGFYELSILDPSARKMILAYGGTEIVWALL